MKETDQYRGVCIFSELKRGELTRNSLELISVGRMLADDLQVELSAILMGDQLGALPEELIRYGVDTVYVAEAPVLARYSTGPFHRLMCDLLSDKKPEIVLFGVTHVGMDLAPRVACELKAGLSAHCVDLKIDADSRQMQQICPYFDYMASIVTDKRPQIATVQPGLAQLPEQDDSREGTVVRIEAAVDREATCGVLIIDVESIEEDDSEKIEEADIIIAMGRGLKELKLAQDLAEAVGGVLGATQPVTDAGLLPESRMIGQTGRIVSPGLYIACGISGAGQHIVGMQGAGTIVAINKDKNAPIFKVADYGIVGDVAKIIPAIISSLRMHAA